ncbi:MAG: ABC transporter permease [Actinobacteria bacterium]|nr:ABC transporter permease [Actinomycetota bacterium]
MSAGRRRRPPAAVPERPPLAAVVPATLAAIFFLAPLAGLLWRVRWADLGREMGSVEVRQAVVLSLASSVAATAASAALGIPLAWVLARLTFPGQRLLRALTTLPMVLPPVVGGVALLSAFGRSGLVGQWLDRWFGLSLPFSPAGVVLAQTFVAMPFLVITAEAAFRRSDPRLEEAARTLGASPSVVFRRVTLPLVSPSLLAGAVLCWARAIGEFGATITFAGNFPGRTQTIPLKVYLLLETRPQAAITLSLVLLALSLAVLVGLRSRWWAPA